MFMLVKTHLQALEKKQQVIDDLKEQLRQSKNRDMVLTGFIRNQTPRDKMADYDPHLLSDQEFRDRYFPTPRKKNARPAQ